MHLAVCGVLLLGSTLVPYFAQNLAASASFSPLLSIYRALNATPWVSHAQVNTGQTVMATDRTGQTKTTQLNVIQVLPVYG